LDREDWVKKGEIDVRMQLEEEGVEGRLCITITGG